jgi:alpha-amylase
VQGDLDVPGILTWADTERDLSAWVGNDMQRAAIEETYSLESSVMGSGKQDIIDDWRKLQTSDHFYYMCTKYFNDGDVHAYFNPYENPYEAYIAHKNALEDLKWRLERYTV